MVLFYKPGNGSLKRSQNFPVLNRQGATARVPVQNKLFLNISAQETPLS